ncbi:hypothetical protein [Streptomyces sp. NRRL S-813]|uniref:hypothetical protein n=1 Tax=Streptomyces sp. NRRL S-813 TaxID=1463919 RepID=UPI0004C06A9E|nr:hypothetical protein [Streptomyces sp. NRRL S-813]
MRTYDDREWGQGIAESANSEADAARRAAVASLDLPGLSADLIENEQFRFLAAELATAGHSPAAWTTSTTPRRRDSTSTPTGSRVGPRWSGCWNPGAIRPGARFEAPEREVERYDKGIEAYAQRLTRPGRTVAVTLDDIQVTYNDAPTRP